MENSVRKREWVKTAAIIFLAVLLVLTFFSKTIMNASLPEVAAQQAASGAINARIRGSGTVEASEVYNVTIKQTRKVASVLVKTGQEINVGDTMFVLEAEDSDELKQAETDLETLQQNYDKSLIEAGNTASQENYDLQKAKEAYNEALAIYNQYSSVSATQLATQKAAADAKLKELQTAKTTDRQPADQAERPKKITRTLKSTVTEHEATVKSLEEEKEKLKDTLLYAKLSEAIYSKDDYESSIKNLKKDFVAQLAQYDSAFNDFYNMCDKSKEIMDECYKSDAAMAARIGSGRSTTGSEGQQNIQTYAYSDDLAATYRAAYENLANCYSGGGGNVPIGLYKLQELLQIATINDKIKEANQRNEHGPDHRRQL